MKKNISLIYLMIITSTVFGQQQADQIMKARGLAYSGNPDQAINLLTEAISAAKDSRLYVERAELKMVQGDYSGAISDLNEANKIIPLSGEYGLSRIYSLKGDPATSLYHLELNLRSAFKKGEKEVMLDPSFGRIDNSSEWRQFWKKEWYSLTEKSISEIEYYISTGKIDESRAILSELKKSYHENDDVLYAEALINFASGRYYEVVKVMPGLISSHQESEKYLRLLAKAQSGASNPAGSSVSYTQLLNMGVADSELLILRADCYRKTGESDKALGDIEKYLEIYPDNKSAIRLAGKVEASAGDNLKAMEYFSRNIRLHPNDPECYIDRANSYFVSRSWDWAIKDYSMSLDLKPTNSEIWLNKGIALLNQGKTEDACHDFRKSLSQGNKSAAEYIGRNCIK